MARPAKRAKIFSRPTIKDHKLPEKTTTYHCGLNMMSMMKRESNLNKSCKLSLPTEKLKTEEVASEVWGVIDYDRNYLLRVREGN